MASLALLFAVVFVLNVLPAFAPPTWMVLSFVGLRYADANVWLIAGIAASAATAGRVLLARCAHRIAGSRWIGPGLRDNLSVVAETIGRRRAASALSFLLFAFSPLPSNALFLAYGLTRAPLWLLALPFFVGRFVSYAAAFAGGVAAGRWFEPESLGAGSWLYFVITQLAVLGTVWAFTRIDWRRTRRERRLRWLKSKPAPGGEALPQAVREHPARREQQAGPGDTEAERRDLGR